MLERELQYFEKNQDEIRRKYYGKEIIIANDAVLGAFDSASEAFQTAKKTLKPGGFIIKKVRKDPEDEVEFILRLSHE